MLIQLPTKRKSAKDISEIDYRRRILRSFAKCMYENGYSNTTINAIATEASVSLRTFYQLFAGKQDCYLALVDDAISSLSQTLSDVEIENLSIVEQLDKTIGVYLRNLAGDPEVAKAYIVESFAVGEAAVKKRRQHLRLFENFFRGIYSVAKQQNLTTCDEEPDFEFLVSAIAAMVTFRIASGESSGLPKLQSRILRFVRIQIGLAPSL